MVGCCVDFSSTEVELLVEDFRGEAPHEPLHPVYGGKTKRAEIMSTAGQTHSISKVSDLSSCSKSALTHKSLPTSQEKNGEIMGKYSLRSVKTGDFLKSSIVLLSPLQK